MQQVAPQAADGVVHLVIYQHRHMDYNVVYHRKQYIVVDNLVGVVVVHLPPQAIDHLAACHKQDVVVDLSQAGDGVVHLVVGGDGRGSSTTLSRRLSA